MLFLTLGKEFSVQIGNMSIQNVTVTHYITENRLLWRYVAMVDWMSFQENIIKLHYIHLKIISSSLEPDMGFPSVHY